MKSRIMIACLAASCAAACLALWSGDEGRLRALEVAKPPSHRPAARRNTPQTDAAYQVLSRDSEGMEQLQTALKPAGRARAARSRVPKKPQGQPIDAVALGYADEAALEAELRSSFGIPHDYAVRIFAAEEDGVAGVEILVEAPQPSRTQERN